MNKQRKYYGTSMCQKETPPPILNKKHKYYTTSICQKKPPHPILNKKIQVLCHVHLPKELHPIVNIAYVQPFSS